MSLEPGGQFSAGISEQDDRPRTEGQVVCVAAQLDGGDAAGMDGEGKLRLQSVDRTEPVDARAGPLIGAVTQTFKPAGLEVLVRKPAVDASGVEPTQRGDVAGWPLLQQIVYFGSHMTTIRRRMSPSVNCVRRLARSSEKRSIVAFLATLKHESKLRGRSWWLERDGFWWAQ